MTQIPYNKTGVIELVPPEGLPDSSQVSLEIFTTEDTPLTGGTFPVTLTASPTTTTSAITYAGSDVLNLTSVANIRRDRNYILIDGEGAQHDVRVVGVDTAESQVKIDQQFTFDIPSGVAFSSNRFTYTLETTQTAVKRRGVRAEWSYTIDTEPVFRVTRFDIVAQPFHLNVTLSDVAEKDLRAKDRIGNLENLKALVRGAYKKLRTDLTTQALYPDLIRNRDALEEALIYAILEIYYSSQESSQKVAMRYEEKYRDSLGKALNSELSYDGDDDQNIEEDEDAPIGFLGVG